MILLEVFASLLYNLTYSVFPGIVFLFKLILLGFYPHALGQRETKLTKKEPTTREVFGDPNVVRHIFLLHVR